MPIDSPSIQQITSLAQITEESSASSFADQSDNVSETTTSTMPFEDSTQKTVTSDFVPIKDGQSAGSDKSETDQEVANLNDTIEEEFDNFEKAVEADSKRDEKTQRCIFAKYLYLKSIFKYFFFMYFHLYFEDFLKKYLYLYFLIEKNSDFKYKYILFQKNKFSLLSHAKFYDVVPGGVRNGKFLILTPFKKNPPKSMKPPRSTQRKFASKYKVLEVFFC